MFPDWQGRIQFWLDAARVVSGRMALVAAVIASRWFGVGLIAFGVGYLLFIGEPERQIRHPLVPILGWAAVVAVMLLFGFVLTVGYTASRLDPDRLAIVETIHELEGGGTIALRCEPVSQSVRVTDDRMSLNPETEYRVEGKRVKLLGKAVDSARETLTEPEGNITVWYIKRKPDCE